MKKITGMLLAVTLALFALTGCGAGASEDKPISEVKTEAQGMSVDQLKSVVSKYQTAIESKKAELSKITAELQKIPVAQMLGDEAGKLKTDIRNVTDSIRALTERLNAYARTLKSKMQM